MKRLVSLLSATILIIACSPPLLAQIGPTQRNILPDPPRFILQIGGNLSVPVGDLGSTDPMGGGFATQDIGLELRGYLALTRQVSIIAGYSRPGFGYDTTMLEDQLGLVIENPKQGFTTLHTGVRFLFSGDREAMSYLQAGVGKYQYKSQATHDRDPLVDSVDQELGYSIGAGVMNRHMGPGFDVTFAIHFTDVTFPNGNTMKTRWLSFTIMTGLAAGSVK